MDPYIRQALEKWEVPGLAIAVVKDGETVLSRGYGVCEVGTDRKVTAETRFTIASCAKSFTAARDTYSTVGDMAQWLKLQLAEGTYAERRLLKPETVREMHALQFSVPMKSRPKGNIYAAQLYGSGLGWSVQD